MTWNALSTRRVGGLNVSPMLNLTRPLVTMRATADEVVFIPRFGIHHLVGPWRVSRAEVLRLRLAPGRFLGSGVEFHLRDGRLWTFWTAHPTDAIADLAYLGFPAE